MVPCFKKPPGGKLLRDKEIFNMIVAKPRVTSEHSIGILKSRFPFLRSIRFRITDNIETMRKVIRYIAVCIILHNLLIGFGDECDMDDDDISIVDEENELNKPIPCDSGSDARRMQLKNYIMEKFHV